MLFAGRRDDQVAVERLARLLSEKPLLDSGGTKLKQRDLCRAFVRALLVASVAGTWSMAYFL